MHDCSTKQVHVIQQALQRCLPNSKGLRIEGCALRPTFPHERRSIYLLIQDVHAANDTKRKPATPAFNSNSPHSPHNLDPHSARHIWNTTPYYPPSVQQSKPSTRREATSCYSEHTGTKATHDATAEHQPPRWIHWKSKAESNTI